MIKILLVLSGPGGVLDRQIIETEEERQSGDIKEAIECWLLQPGDTIRIEDYE